MFEVSARLEMGKWQRDKMKLIVGGRAMLDWLCSLVKQDSAVVNKLRVVGVLQASVYLPP